jgi:hypothetical protein
VAAVSLIEWAPCAWPKCDNEFIRVREEPRRYCSHRCGQKASRARSRGPFWERTDSAPHHLGPNPYLDYREGGAT